MTSFLVLTCTLDWLAHYLFAGLALNSAELRLWGALSIVHFVVYGAAAALKPRADGTYKNRQSRMASQGGHTMMLVYYAGLGPLAELVQILRKAGAGSYVKLQASIRFHALFSSSAQAVLKAVVLQMLSSEATDAGLSSFAHSGADAMLIPISLHVRKMLCVVSLSTSCLVLLLVFLPVFNHRNSATIGVQTGENDKGD
mmetsp:Transcript_32701/g.64051  ORF Transcript_32701/g.64051 Transcript_32701/m.64051 type:complete len:199 (+) Transcript_32701:27-623(+)|eukprot:CAMPEP_0175155258 /NCGR_PEP_ID=MMETSP0087-20121206/20868_1 /TAXON_ID=136419 /ORGANISM="Unknown Unknown, Strain D1" /LENGTH=198 /DNA_ID=CAMNT_0016442379 /DNA_START=26 /DNA_END=622 /DNA_ORIENTATION=-